MFFLICICTSIEGGDEDTLKKFCAVLAALGQDNISLVSAEQVHFLHFLLSLLVANLCNQEHTDHALDQQPMETDQTR